MWAVELYTIPTYSSYGPSPVMGKLKISQMKLRLYFEEKRDSSPTPDLQAKTLNTVRGSISIVSMCNG
jgi:hypothetical protein